MLLQEVHRALYVILGNIVPLLQRAPYLVLLEPLALADRLSALHV